MVITRSYRRATCGQLLCEQRRCFSKGSPAAVAVSTELFGDELYPVAGFHPVAGGEPIEDAEALEMAVRRGHAGRQAFDRVIRRDADDPQVQGLRGLDLGNGHAAKA